MSSPKFSIILPTYNRLHCVGKAIATVCQQTLTDYELLIVNDGSTDGTADWLQENYPPNRYPQITIINLPVNQGPAGARNAAIAKSKGDWIAFLDSDDEWLPEFLERHWQSLSTCDNPAMSACDAIAIQLNFPAEELRTHSRVWSIYSNPTEHMLMSSMIWSMSLVVVNRNYLLQVGGFNEQLRMCEDREMYLRVLQFGEYIHLPEPLVRKIQTPDSLTKNLKLYARESIRAVDFFLDSSEGKPYRRLRQIAKSRWSMTVAKMMWERRQNLIFAALMLIRAVYYSPSLVNQAFQRRWQVKNSVSDTRSEA